MEMITKHFSKKEMRCKCKNHCEATMSAELMVMLEMAREISDTPYVIVSAFRCKDHNKAVGGVDDSSHVKREAVDIRTLNSVERYKVLKGLIRAGFNRIGIYKTFIHADVDKKKPMGVIWYQ